MAQRWSSGKPVGDGGVQPGLAPGAVELPRRGPGVGGRPQRAAGLLGGPPQAQLPPSEGLPGGRGVSIRPLSFIWFILHYASEVILK